MRVVIGGAYNGKRAYVKSILEKEGIANVPWYEGVLPNSGQEMIVVTDLERWLITFEGEETLAIEQVLQALKNRKSIVILTDISRGIVPMDAETRELRDRCGRLYQKVIGQAEEVIQLWYGIPKKIKGEK